MKKSIYSMYFNNVFLDKDLFKVTKEYSAEILTEEDLFIQKIKINNSDIVLLNLDTEFNSSSDLISVLSNVFNNIENKPLLIYSTQSWILKNTFFNMNHNVKLFDKLDDILEFLHSVV